MKPKNPSRIGFLVLFAFSLGLAPARAETPEPAAPDTTWTCSALCGYYAESAIAYDPSQDLVIASGDSPAEAYAQVKKACVQFLLGQGKFRERDYPILLVEESASAGAVTVRATPANACVKDG